MDEITQDDIPCPRCGKPNARRCNGNMVACNYAAGLLAERDRYKAALQQVHSALNDRRRCKGCDICEALEGNNA